MKKYLFALIALLTPLVANADAVEIDGIYYNLILKAKEAEVTTNPNKYAGDVIIPDKVTYEGVEYNVTSIGEYAFKDCNGLISVLISNNVTSIGLGAFSNCSMTSVTIGNNVTSIDAGAFYWCSGLTSIIIPNNVTTIGSNAFGECRGLTSLTIPNSVTSIGNGAFLGCTGLTSVTIGSGMTYISNSTFSGCTSLTSLTIPNSVTQISFFAFQNCSSLTSLTIPNSVNYIDGSAFKGCTGLTSITIGSGVYSIGSSAFGNCVNLTDVYCLKELAVIIYLDAFENSYIEYATLHVPVGSVESYQGREPWSNFNRIIDYDEVSVSSSNIRTYSSIYDLDFTNATGLSAYAISGFSAGEGTLVLTPVSQAKAGEGLLIKGDAGNYSIPHTTTDATYTNYLVGIPTTTSVSPTNGDYTNFVLADGTYGVNFYALSKTGNISAGKAYLRLPTADINQVSQSRGFSFIDGGTTSIQAVRPSNYKEGVFFDLQGRRVNNPSKGLYILNGKKVIIK